MSMKWDIKYFINSLNIKNLIKSLVLTFMEMSFNKLI